MANTSSADEHKVLTDNWTLFGLRRLTGAATQIESDPHGAWISEQQIFKEIKGCHNTANEFLKQMQTCQN